MYSRLTLCKCTYRRLVVSRCSTQVVCLFVVYLCCRLVLERVLVFVHQTLTLRMTRSAAHKLVVRMPSRQQLFSHTIDKFSAIIREKDSGHAKIRENMTVKLIKSLSNIVCMFAVNIISKIELRPMIYAVQNPPFLSIWRLSHIDEVNMKKKASNVGFIHVPNCKVWQDR